MQAAEFQQLISRTEASQVEALKRICWGQGSRLTRTNPPNNHEGLMLARLTQAAMGITKEGGELLSLIEKLVWYGKQMTLEDIKLKIKDEGGDVLWYLAQLFNAVGLDMEEVMKANIRKLTARYPDKFTPERASEENRDRAAEEQALNSGGNPLPELKAKPNLPKRCGVMGQDLECCACGERLYGRYEVVCPYQNGTKRTYSQVLAERANAVGGGCCDKFADHSECTCLDDALLDVDSEGNFILPTPTRLAADTHKPGLMAADVYRMKAAIEACQEPVVLPPMPASITWPTIPLPELLGQGFTTWSHEQYGTSGLYYKCQVCNEVVGRPNLALHRERCRLDIPKPQPNLAQPSCETGNHQWGDVIYYRDGHGCRCRGCKICGEIAEPAITE